MSYNWVDASTKQGLERFKELGDMKLAVITRSGDGTISECFCEPDGTIVINQVGYEDWEDAEENNAFFSLEFLDPLLTQQIDENGLLPCPFCGEKADVFGEALMCSIGCKSCELGFLEVGYSAYANLKVKWNTRAGKETNP